MLADIVTNTAFTVLGLVLGAAFEDRLRKGFARAQRWWRRHRVRGTRLVAPHQRFRIGPLVTDAYVYDGDGTTPYSPDRVTIRVNPVDVELPPEVAGWREELAAEERAHVAATGEPRFWNGLRYAVAGVSMSRESRNEEPRITFTFEHADYYTFLAAQQLDRPLSDGTTLRERYLSGRDVADVPAFLSCSFGVNVAVVTRDERLVVSLRSGELGSGRNRWNSSVNEGVSRDIDSSGRSAPDLFQVAERGLREELALEYGEYDLTLLGFAVDTGHHQWAALFLAELRSLDAAELRERHSRGIADRWENRLFEYVRFEPDTVLRYLLDPERIDRWAPCAPLLFYFALVHRFGRGAVESAAGRAVRAAAAPARGWAAFRDRILARCGRSRQHEDAGGAT
jgi:hypothetical protein